MRTIWNTPKKRWWLIGLLDVSLLSAFFLFFPAFVPSLTQLAPLESVAYVLGITLFLITLTCWVHVSLQKSMEVTVWHGQEGEKDGMYWFEHLVISVTALLSFFVFGEAVLQSPSYTTGDLFTRVELWAELPLTYVLHTALLLGIVFITITYFSFFNFAEKKVVRMKKRL